MIWRFGDRQSFERLRREGRRVRSGPLWWVALPDPAAEHARVAFAIGRPVGPAVVRNRLRRRLRELARAEADRLPPGWYLIGGQPTISSLSFAEMSEMFTRLIERTFEHQR